MSTAPHNPKTRPLNPEEAQMLDLFRKALADWSCSDSEKYKSMEAIEKLLKKELDWHLRLPDDSKWPKKLSDLTPLPVSPVPMPGIDWPHYPPQLPDKQLDWPGREYCLHDACKGCKDGSCNGIHMISCPCKKCSPWSSSGSPWCFDVGTGPTA